MNVSLAPEESHRLHDRQPSRPSWISGLTLLVLSMTGCSACGPNVDQKAEPAQLDRQLQELHDRGRLDSDHQELIRWYQERARADRIKNKSIKELLVLAQKQLQADAENWTQAKKDARTDLMDLLQISAKDFPGLAVSSDRGSAQSLARLIRPNQIASILDEQLKAFEEEPKQFYKVVPILARTVDKVALAVWEPVYQHVSKRANMVPESLRRRQEQDSLPALSRYLSHSQELAPGERTRLKLHLSLVAAMGYQKSSPGPKSQPPWTIAYRAWKRCGVERTSRQLKALTLATRAYRDRLSAAPTDPRIGIALLQARTAIDGVTRRCSQGNKNSDK